MAACQPIADAIAQLCPPPDDHGPCDKGPGAPDAPDGGIDPSQPPEPPQPPK
jgi:hypothetical protein